MTDLWEKQVEQPWMRGSLNMAQMTLVSALQLELRNPEFQWRPEHPRLVGWTEEIAGRPSIAATAPPAPSGMG